MITRKDSAIIFLFILQLSMPILIRTILPREIFATVSSLGVKRCPLFALAPGNGNNAVLMSEI
jgi:hypothetical protein